MKGNIFFKYIPFFLLSYTFPTSKLNLINMKFTNRIFYIDITNISPMSVSNYIDGFKKEIEKDESQVIKGLKKLGLWEDFYLPIHGITKVEYHHIDININLDTIKGLKDGK